MLFGALVRHMYGGKHQLVIPLWSHLKPLELVNTAQDM